MKQIEQLLATIGCYLIETKKKNHKMVHSFYMSQPLTDEIVNELNSQVSGYQFKINKDSWSKTKSLTVISK